MGRWVLVGLVVTAVVLAITGWINRLDDAAYVSVFVPMVIIGTIIMSVGMIFIAGMIFQGLNALVRALENRQRSSKQEITPRGYQIRR